MLIDNTVLKNFYLDRTKMIHTSERNIAAGLASSKSSNLRTLTGFCLGPVLTVRGSPKKLENYSNGQVLKYLAEMWRHQTEAENKLYNEKVINKRENLEDTASANPNSYVLTDIRKDVHNHDNIDIKRDEGINLDFC